MAKNTAWLRDYFNGAKIVLWAHNFHVSDYPAAGSMGHHLKTDFSDDYMTVGFLFSKGSFMAVTQVNNQFQGLNSQSLEEDPKPGSMNDVMLDAEAPVFAVKISGLQDHDAWRKAFQQGIEYFQIGSVYTNDPSSYYEVYSGDYFDWLIYFKRTTSSVQLE